MASLYLKNLSKTYPGGVTAVRDFSLKIKDQEFLILVGPSGCGKTTVLRMIAGLEEISAGELYIDDRLVNDVAAKDRDIAMVFQNYALYPHLSVYDNMAFGLKLRKIPKAEIRKNVQEAARILALEDLLKRKPKELSGGQRQRVALGRAIVRKPKVFLMDEPLSNLDAQLRTQMRIEIAKLHKNLQTTFVYVTHDQTEAMTMGTRIVVMKDGLIQQIDSPQSIYDHPVNMFVAGFLGSPGMNFLEVLIVEQKGCIFAKLADALLPVPTAEGQRLKEQGYLDRKAVLGIRAEHLCGSEDFLYLSESITSLHTARRPNACEDSAARRFNPCEDSVFVVCSISATNGFAFARLGEAGFSLDRHPECALRGRLEFSELRGAETYHYVRIAGREVVVRVSPELRAEIGQEVRVGFNMSKAHFFDQESEVNVSRQ